MKVTQKTAKEGRLTINAVASAKEVDSAFSEAQLMFAQQMNLPPTQGKTIAQVAKEQMGIIDLDGVVRPQVVQLLIPFALDKKDIVPAYPPKPTTSKEPERGKEYSFSLDISVKPEYELTSYEPISITLAPFAIDEREVEDQITQMAESYVEFVAQDPRPIQENDALLIGMECFDEKGEAIAPLNIESRTYIMNAGLMPPDFDKNIMGMNVGEAKTFTFVGPGMDEAGKQIEQKITCTATVKELQKKVIPAINDEWVAKNMPMFPNLEMMKGAIRKQLEDARSFEYTQYQRQIAASELAKRFEGKIADEVYEAMRQVMLESLQRQVAQQGMDMNAFIQQNGGEQQFGMLLMMQTRQNLIEGYSLDALYRHEKLSIDDDDLTEAARAMDPQNPKKVKEHMLNSGYGYALRESASRIKASKWLIEHADITIEEPKN